MDRGSGAVDDAPRPFSKGSGGDCIVEALAKRGIGYKYLRPEQVTNTEVTGRTVAEFRINDATYYFGGGSLRVSDPHGVRVPGRMAKAGSSAASRRLREDSQSAEPLVAV